MKKRWPIIKGCLAAVAMGLLILDTKTALAGAQRGVDLCVQTVIPSLFPFFILSILLTGAATGYSFRFLSTLCHLFQIPKGTEGLLLAGFFGGYPVGAQCVSQAFENGLLSEIDARKMLVICNNCGPAFLFGMAAAVFNIWYVPWLLWGIQIISSLVVARFLPGDCFPVRCKKNTSLTLVNALDRAVKVTAAVCGWVVLFRVIIAFLDSWALWLFPTEVQVAISGILELSNGCYELFRLDNLGLRFILCAGMLNLGGICVTLQTMAVTSERMDRNLYFPGKVFQCCISLFLAWFVHFLLFSPENRYSPTLPIAFSIGIMTVIFGSILRKRKIRSSIPEKLGV